MGVKTLAIVLAAATYCHGAAILTENDEWFEAAQALLRDPESLVTALGAQRVKRDVAYDKEFTVAALGLGFGLKYTDSSNPMKGGKAYAKFPLKQFVPAAHSSMVDLQMSFDGGDAIDGLFTMTVDYALTHSDGHGDETGSFKFVRKMEGGKWKTEISTTSDANFAGKRRIPLFSIISESDRATTLSSVYQGTYGSASLKVDRVPGQKLAAEFDVNGMKYSFTVTLDKPNMAAEVVINAAGKQFNLKGQVSKTDSWKLDISGDINGPIEATVLIKKDFTEAKIQLSHDNKKLLQMRLKGKMNSDGSFQAKAKFSLLGGKLATGEFDASYANGKFNIVLKPSNMEDIDLTVYFQPAAGVTKFGYEAKKGGNSMMKYDAEHKRTDDAAKYEGSLKTDLQVSEQSLMYPMFCKIGNAVGSGCFKSRQMEITTFVDKRNRNFFMNKFAFGLKNVKDGETRLDFSISTVQNPYQLKIVSPRLASKIGSNELVITANHQPGRQLEITSSYQQFKALIKHEGISNGKNIFAEVSKGGVSFLKYNLDLTFIANPQKLQAGVKSQFDVNEASMFYPVFCSYGSGCFKQRKADFTFFIDRVNKNALLNKFEFKGELTKDAEKVFELDISTKSSPYKFVVKAPYMMPAAIGQPSIEVSAVHNPGQSLEVTSNFAKARSFSVKKNGNMREVEFNGKLLFKGEVTKGDNSFRQAIELADGRNMALTVSWADDGSAQSNSIKMNLAGDNINADVDVDWDVTNPLNGEFEVEAKGTGPRLGQFEFEREIDWDFNGNRLVAKIIGKSSSTKGPFAAKGLSPIETKINIDFDVNKVNLNADLVKVIAGRRYAVNVKDNTLGLSL